MELRSDNNDPKRFYLDDILVDYSHFLHWAHVGQYAESSSTCGNIPHRIGEIAWTLTITGEALAGVDRHGYKPSATYVLRCLKELASFGYNLFP